MSGALLPRVRVITVCDEALASEVEFGVFTLENVRFQAVAESFPHVRTLTVYLLLSHYREGHFTGTVQLFQDTPKRMIRYARFGAPFDGETECAAVAVEMEQCVFPTPGYYTFEVHIADESLVEHPKAEYQIRLRLPEDQS